ncbi:hypothetical protein DACRYDRAFT_105005 [Dacryopinax primogenitus]|uniref:HNH nuclease domain-containing protein n=1 Tax=Dacryopinax primogenitus (strain DJM 731) TaxID=1858805 RepID=M5GE66_DACPD|nr:uncharacterized protein DACRYDRAFT_105005 [Dacryopinax primogenitus]EJU05122.1 hypothetical protein DACRYDRAFT_105005 [Dacryopinax primogenitus]
MPSLAVKRAGTPTPSRHPSRPSFEDQAAFYAMVIDPGPMDQRTSKAKALARDRYRCMFSGLIDDTSALAGLVETPLPVGPTATTAPTELCHIIPQGLLSRWEQDDERDRSSTCLARMFGDVQFPMDLSGPETHRLENVLTLNPIWHARFDSLKCYLESTTTPDLYVLKVWEPFIENGNSFLDLKSDNPDFPAPSPQLLAIHRSRAIVAHLSGAAKYVELHPEEDEEDRYAVLSGIRHDEPTAREVFIAALWARFPSARALAPQKME